MVFCNFFLYLIYYIILCDKKLQNSALKMIFVFSIFTFCYGILIFKLHIIELNSLKFYRLIFNISVPGVFTHLHIQPQRFEPYPCSPTVVFGQRSFHPNSFHSRACSPTYMFTHCYCSPTISFTHCNCSPTVIVQPLFFWPA